MMGFMRLTCNEVALLDTPLGRPGVRLHDAEALVAAHHPRATFLVVLQSDETVVAVPLAQTGPALGQDVGVQVDLHRDSFRGAGGISPPLPARP